MKPALSVVVADFGMRPASEGSLRGCLQALAAQDTSDFIEVMLCEMPEICRELTEKIRDIVPGLQIVPCPDKDRWARKTVGARKASAPILAFVDADYLPKPSWARSILDTFQYYPEVAVVSGRIASERPNWFLRFLPDWRKAGLCRRSAGNNIAFRREAYLDCPFPEGTGADAVRLQTEALRRAHYVLWTEPNMLAIR